MNQTNLKSNPNFWVEDCCNGAEVIRTYQQWGVRYADGVRRWNDGVTTACECSKCGKKLSFWIRKPKEDSK